MVEFSGEKIKPLRLPKPFEHMQIYIRLKCQFWDLNLSLWLQIMQPRYAKNVK